jgi:hypothetical protein
MGVDDFITKPHDLDALAGRLDRILARYDSVPRGALGTKTMIGDLDQVSLSTLLTHFADDKKSGVLLLVREQARATVYISEGRVIKCDLERNDLTGVEKVLAVLSWRQGRFEFASQDVPASDEIQMPVPDLLAEHARRLGASAKTA